MRTQIELSQNSSFALVKRILRYFSPYKGYIALSIVCLLLVAACTAGTAWLIRPAMDDIFLNRNERALVLVPLAYIVLTLLKGLGRYGQNTCMNYSALNVLRRIRYDVFYKMIHMPLNYFERSETGALMSHITNDVAVMQRSLPACILIIRQSLTMIALMGVVLYQNFQLALWAMVALPLVAIPIRWFSKKLRHYGRRNANLNAEITTLIQEMLSGVRVIKAFATEEASAQRFGEENQRLQDIALHQNRVNELASPTMEFISSIGIALIIWFGGAQVLEGKMTAGAFFSFIGALAMMYDPFKSMNSALMELQNALAGAERVFGMLDSQTYHAEEGGSRKVEEPFHSLSFENVTFSYPASTNPALKDANLTIRAGERIALVGPSGAGKTTFVNLIPRFYNPQEGQILFNGRPLAEYDLGDLRRHIAIVSQDSFLFNMSAADNIAYGKPHASQEAIEKAAHSAYADTFVREMPEGYATPLGERGARLSGGQKQRLTIARAILKDAPLLILDEATSALDSEAESMVQKALDNLMEGKTSIVIAHRLSTILGADRILVMDQGSIVAAGRHEELLQTSELYARLYALQFKTD